ncbi:hypothetical protein [Microbacterium gilvum]|uniref:Preprotein translocase subunit TatA n=1 Tax=Microbacterium gilvum TaxID=1336204 RepID=A0ABP8ZW41_9MICO
MPALAVLAAATPSPVPTVDPDLVTPGPLGFLTIALLVVVVFLLVADMLRRVRRAKYREEANAVLDAEEAAAADARADSPDGERPDDADDGDGAATPGR